MRVACSGGRYPLDNGSDDSEDSDVDDNDELGDESEEDQKKKPVKCSDFVFTSKFHTLITELERIRDEDSTCKSTVKS